MRQWLVQFVVRLIGRAISSIWSKEEPKMLSTSINIHGKSVPLSVFKALTDLAPTIFEGIENGKSAKEIVASVEQEAGTAALAVVESVVNIFFPGAGTAIEVIEFILKHRVAQTQEEVNAFMDRFGIGEG